MGSLPLSSFKGSLNKGNLRYKKLLWNFILLRISIWKGNLNLKPKQPIFETIKYEFEKDNFWECIKKENVEAILELMMNFSLFSKSQSYKGWDKNPILFLRFFAVEIVNLLLNLLSGWSYIE